MRMGSRELCLVPAWLFLAAGAVHGQQDPQVIRDQAADEVQRAHDALRRYDTGAAVEALRKATGLLGRLGSGDMMEIEVGAGAGVMSEKDPVLQQLSFVLEAAATPTLEAEALGEAFGPDYERDLAAEEMKELKEEAERLKAEQEQVTQEIGELQEETEREAAEGDEQRTQEGQADQAKTEPGGEPAGEGEGRPEDEAGRAAARQAEVARNAARMADEIREIAGEEDMGAQKAADRFLAAAADAQNAAAKVRQQDFKAAHKSAERAGNELDEALATLKGMSKQEVNFLVDRVVAKLEGIAAEQHRLRTRTDELAEGLDTSRTPDTGTPEPATLRDVKALAPRQDRLRKAMESVEFDLDVLRRWAEAEAGHEARQSVLAAHDAARRGRVPQKMTNAIVAYSEFDLRAASREQKAAERGVARILSKVQDAYASTASDPISELKAAQIEARKIEENLGTLVDDADRQRQGDERKPDAEGRERKGEEPPPPLGPDERRRLGERAASRIGRLQRRVESRELAVPEEDMRRLTEVLRGRPGELGRMAEREDAGLADLRGAARRVHDRLETEYESALNAKRLFQAQREECPPQYRSLVNKYFEALSEAVEPRRKGKR